MRAYNGVEETRMPTIIKARKHRRIDPAIPMRTSMACPIPEAVFTGFVIVIYHSLKPRLAYPSNVSPSGNLSQDRL